MLRMGWGKWISTGQADVEMKICGLGSGACGDLQSGRGNGEGKDVGRLLSHLGKMKDDGSSEIGEANVRSRCGHVRNVIYKGKCSSAPDTEWRFDCWKRIRNENIFGPVSYSGY